MGNLRKMHDDHRFSKPIMGKKAYPLRKVIDWYTNDYGIVKEKLECGHEITRPSDFIGYTVAKKRRCFECFNNKDK